MTTCKGCGAEIRWAKTKNGKSIPLDAEPNSEGNVVFEESDTAYGVAVVLGPAEAALARSRGMVWMPHHATCPKVVEFQR